jgi:hypothetical protein
METTLIAVIFGHFIGDFFLQTKAMADNKYHFGMKGFFSCTVHVLVYTLTVAVFANNFAPFFLLGVYLPHWIVDKWSLAYHWMKLIGRSDLINNSNQQKAAFGAIIYVVIDQTIHLGCLYILLTLI